MKRFMMLLIPLTGMLVPAQAQVSLGTAINEPGLPDEDAIICEIPLELTIGIEDGPQEGDLVNDFYLYDTEGNEAVLSDILEEGKPVLLISGSYSCMVFRGKVNLINNIINERTDELTVLVVYTVEAHPDGDISPYYGYVNTGEQNFDEGVLEPQAVTYGQRREQAVEMIDALGLEARVLIDGPCNAWWESYGSAPNNAYLIDTNGYVYDAETWLDRAPEDVRAAIAGLLGEDVTGSPVPLGTVEMTSYDEDCVEGEPATTVIAHAYFENADTVDALLEVIRLSEDMPGSWATSICTDLCYPPETEYVDMLVEAGSSATLSFYFYTTLAGSEGQAELLIRNIYKPLNSFEIILKACTSVGGTTSVETIQRDIYLYPNPAADQLQVLIPGWTGQQLVLQLVSHSGQIIRSYPTDLDTINPVCSVPLKGLPAGRYLIQVKNTHTNESFTETFIKN